MLREVSLNKGVTLISSLVARRASVRHVSSAKLTERQCFSEQLFSVTANHESLFL